MHLQHLEKLSYSSHVQSWDVSRTKYTDSLESILESLGGQVVPPEFHETSAHSSLFGSQHSDDSVNDDDEPFQQPDMTLSIAKRNGTVMNPLSPPSSPSATLRRYSSVTRDKGKGKARNIILEERRKRAKADRTRWKTLRDFVDDRAIEEILEGIDNERNDLEVIRLLLPIPLC